MEMIECGNSSCERRYPKKECHTITVNKKERIICPKCFDRHLYQQEYRQKYRQENGPEGAKHEKALERTRRSAKKARENEFQKGLADTSDPELRESAVRRHNNYVAAGAKAAATWKTKMGARQAEAPQRMGYDDAGRVEAARQQQQRLDDEFRAAQEERDREDQALEDEYMRGSRGRESYDRHDSHQTRRMSPPPTTSRHAQRRSPPRETRSPKSRHRPSQPSEASSHETRSTYDPVEEFRIYGPQRPRERSSESRHDVRSNSPPRQSGQRYDPLDSAPNRHRRDRTPTRHSTFDPLDSAPNRHRRDFTPPPRHRSTDQPSLVSTAPGTSLPSQAASSYHYSTPSSTAGAPSESTARDSRHSAASVSQASYADSRSHVSSAPSDYSSAPSRHGVQRSGHGRREREPEDEDEDDSWRPLGPSKRGRH